MTSYSTASPSKGVCVNVPSNIYYYSKVKGFLSYRLNIQPLVRGHFYVPTYNQVLSHLGTGALAYRVISFLYSYGKLVGVGF